MKLKLAAVIAAVLVGSAASAATCKVNTVTFTLNNAGGADCRTGNDFGWNGIADHDLEFFSLTNWAAGDSTEAGAGDGTVNFASAPLVGATSGTWSLSDYAGMGPLMIVLRSGHQFGAFLLDEAFASLSGTWDIQRDRCSKNGCTSVGKALSRATVYYSEPSAVPLPAAGFMMLAGLGGLVALRRRRKAA